MRRPSPQPLSKLIPHAAFVFDPACLENDLRAASLVVTSITNMSGVEAQMIDAVSVFTSQDPAMMHAMIRGISGQTGKRKAIETAASILPPERLALFNLATKAIAPSRMHRDRFAHHLWGTSSDLPNAWLLAPPRLLSESMARAIALKRSTPEQLADVVMKAIASNDVRSALLGMDVSQILVYSNEDLKAVATEAREALLCVQALLPCVDPERQDFDRWRTAFLARPLIMATQAA